MGKLSYGVVLEWDETERLVTATVPAFAISTYGSDRREALEKSGKQYSSLSMGFKQPANQYPRR